MRTGQSPRHGTHGSVYYRPIEKTHQSKEVISEKGARRTPEIAQEVERKVENERKDKLVRQITDERGSGFSKGMVEAKLDMLLDDGTIIP